MTCISLLQFTKEVMSPLPDWGPALSEHRTDMYAPVIPQPMVRQIHPNRGSGEMNFAFQKSKESLANLSVNASGYRTPNGSYTPVTSRFSSTPNMLEQNPDTLNNVLHKSIIDNARQVFGSRTHRASETCV